MSNHSGLLRTTFTWGFLFRILFTGEDPWDRPLDNATFFRAATARNPNVVRKMGYRPDDYMRLALWRVWLARFLFIWPPQALFWIGVVLAILHKAGGWVLLLPVFYWWMLCAIAGYYGVEHGLAWWRARFNYHHVVEPTARAVSEALGYRFNLAKAGWVVQLEDDFDLEPLDPDDPENEGIDVEEFNEKLPDFYKPVRINLPKGKVWTDALKKRLMTAVSLTLNMPHSEAHWELHGKQPFVLISRSRRLPTLVTVEQALHWIEQADFEHPVMGLDAKRNPVQADYLESPHELISAATTSGKSTLIGGQLCQRMHWGAGLLILDYKRISHKWAYNLKGCVYAWKVDDIHRYAIAMGEIFEARRNADFDEHGNFPIFPIFDVLLEEANTTKQKLTTYWLEIRDPRKDPLESPAIAALDNLSNMGRELGIHLHYCAQRGSANVFGNRGGDMRENFVHRYLSKWTRQTWTMLANGAPFERWPGGKRGIWLQITPEKTTIFRGVKWEIKEMREWALSGSDCAPIEQDLARVIEASESKPELPAGTASRPERVTLTEAVHYLPGLSLENARTLADEKKNRDPTMPAPVGKRGNPDNPRAAREWVLVELEKWWGDKTGNSLEGDPIVSGLVYAIYCRRHDGLPGVELGYIGQTTRGLETRLSEHLADKPWADLYVGSHVLWPESGKPTHLRQSELDRLEMQYTHEFLPVYPYEGQEGAAHAVPKPVAKEQRWARDDAAGGPRWVDPEAPAASHKQLIHA